MFEAFAQVDGTTTRTYGGTGLGLSIASELIQKMHGRIWIESKPGKGTTFYFTARVPVGLTPVPDVRRADSLGLGGLRVLVADDNAINRRVLQEMLTNWHMRPTVVVSGAAALDEMLRAAKSQMPFALVLLDGMMPGMDGFTVAERIRENPELSGATVLMFSSSMPKGAAARCRELAVASYLTKPVTQSGLLDAILIALGGEGEAIPKSEPEGETQVLDPFQGAPRILLAEDNAINRAVAIGILEKQGHKLTYACNGREAVDACKLGVFDVILMDIQMPEMDGFEATRLIREMQMAHGTHTPIVAMTAHAMAGDRERCLAGGMDGYVSKPLSKAKLLQAVADFGGSVPPQQAPPILPAKKLMHNAEELLAELGNNNALAERVIALFSETIPEVITTLGHALAARDTQTLGRTAHKLVGSFGAIGARGAASLARDLEADAEKGDLASAARVLVTLEDETNTILAGLGSIRDAVCALGV
ncbi:MAG: response regulator [Chthoniobacterales bacterium]